MGYSAHSQRSLLLRFASIQKYVWCAVLLVLGSWIQQPANAQGIQNLSNSTAVGSASTGQVIVSFRSSGTVASISAVTQGVAGQDFAATSGGSCQTGQAYAAGDRCTVAVTFTPGYPGTRLGAVFVQDSANAVLAMGLVSGQASGALPMFVPGTVNTYVGQGDWTYAGDGVPATNAPIFTPKGVVLDAAGNIYLSDNGNNRIRRVNAQSGVITTIAGSGFPGYSGDGGPAPSADIDSPAGLAVDGAGNIYFADELNNVIRRIDASSQIITTVAGTPRVRGYSGNGGAATSAQLDRPLGVSIDVYGNLLIADTGNNAIRLVDAVTGSVRTVAGTNTSGYNGDSQPAITATLNSPMAALGLPDGTLLISDTGNHRVRKVDLSGQITTIAGDGSPRYQGEGGQATLASLKEPIGLAVDPAGNLYIADSGNNRVRRVAAGTGVITTVMGNDNESFAGDTGPANLASMYGPFGLYFTQDGALYLSDLFHMRIRAIVTNRLSLTYPTMRRGKASALDMVTLANGGNAALQLASPVFQMSALDDATTTCITAAQVPPLQTCKLGVEFAPTIIGTDVVGWLTLPSNAVNVAPTIRLDGRVIDVNPTSATVVSSQNPSVAGEALTFTATISSDDHGRMGDVTITSDGKALCTTALRPDGTASCSTSNLGIGSHSIIAHYDGDWQNAAATSATLTQIIKQQTTLRLTSSSNPVVVAAPVTFTLTASAAAGTPTGTVIFLDGATTLGSATLKNGQAALTTRNLTPGTHSIAARYSGDPSDAAGQSNVLIQTVAQAVTSTMLASSSASLAVGGTMNFSATVCNGQDLLPTGMVQFKEGSTLLGTATLSTTGNASFSTSALTPGTHSIVAVYSGDTDNATSLSAPLTETIKQIGTTVTLAASSNPLGAGATLHLSSQVALAPGADAVGALTGSLTFAEGSATSGTVTLDASQQGGLDVHNLTVGTHLLVVTYSGNGNYGASTATLTLTVSQTSASIRLSDAASTTLAGLTASWTAVITSSTGIPSGTVAFRDGVAALGTGTLDSHGVASFETTALAAGSHTITAVYDGDANYIATTSAPVTHVVNLAAPVASLSGPATAVNVTANATFSFTLSHPGVTPTGTVALLDGATVVATQPVNAAGVNTFSTSSLSIGQHSMIATYSGNAYNSGASSPLLTVMVQKAPSVTTLVSSANPAVLGSGVMFNATVTAPTANLTGTVTFLDGAQTIGSAVLTAGVATFTTTQFAFGHHAITAAYAGDAIHAASPSATLDESVTQQAVAGISSSLNPSNSGQPVTFTATLQAVAGLTPSGSVTFTDNGTALGQATLDASGHATLQSADLAIGTHKLGVSFAGDANFSSATASLVQSVQTSTSKTVETVSASPAIYGVPLSLMAVVTTSGGVATGQVFFAENGSSIGSVQLDAAGVAILTTSNLAPGRHTVVANYQTDGRTSASASVPVSFLTQQRTSLALSSDSNPALTLAPVNITATLRNSNAAPSTGEVTFLDGTTRLGSATLTGGRATLTMPSLPAGTHNFTATYPGDDDNFAAAATPVIEIVNLRVTTTSLTSSATNAADPQQMTLIALVESSTPSATARPAGTITFLQGTQVLGTARISTAGLATLNQELETGSKETVTAVYNGDVSYSTSTSSPIDVRSGTPTTFTITLNTAKVQMQSGQRNAMTVTLTSLQGFNDSIRLGCAGLPYAVTCTFDTTNIKLAVDGSVSLQMMLDTGNPLGEGATASAAKHPLERRPSPLLCLLPAAILLVFCRRRRSIPVLLSLLMLPVVTLCNSGCSGLHMASTPPGTYSFQVTGAGMGTGAKQTQTITLTVTQ